MSSRELKKGSTELLVLASGVEAPKPPPVRVDLRDGSRIGGRLRSGDDEMLTIDVDASGQQVAVLLLESGEKGRRLFGHRQQLLVWKSFLPIQQQRRDFASLADPDV